MTQGKNYENIKMFEQLFKEKCKNMLKFSVQLYTEQQPTANICSKDRAKVCDKKSSWPALEQLERFDVES